MSPDADDNAPDLLVIPPSRLPVPVTIRTDAIGIYAVLSLAGFSQLFTNEPGSVADLVDDRIATVWSLTLAIGGALALVAVLMPARRRLTAVGIELICRVALGFGALTYAVAVSQLGTPASSRLLVLFTFLGISIMMLAGAWTLARWIRQQARAVERVLIAQDARHRRERE